MSIFGPRETDSGAEPDADREQEDTPLPTRFGRHGRRGAPPRQEAASEEAREALDGESPFEDDGGL
jgi:hypothetical protein